MTAWTAFRDAFILLAYGHPLQAVQHLRNQMSLFTLSNYTTFFMLLATVGLSIWQARRNAKRNQEAQKKLIKPVLDAPGFPDIEPLEDFDWSTTEPLQIRPFKPKYHLTMDGNTALETLAPSELLLIDKNQKERLELRSKLIKERNDVVVGVSDEKRIRPAVYELYTFLLGTYLPRRYPTLFKIEHMDYESGKVVFCHDVMSGKFQPVHPNAQKPLSFYLEILGRIIDEDFLLLLPSETFEKDGSYVLEAYITCFPSGFNPREKLGKKLRDIHGPVPGYKEKLEGSMDRFFEKLEVGRYVKRVNWSVTVDAGLFAADGKTHAYEGQEKDVHVQNEEELDLDTVKLRCERQTLHRLPKSQALVFAFKTYTYPICEIKEEGSGEAMAEAIDGLKGGSVPGMHYYKRGLVWGEGVKKFLRS